MAAQAYYDHAAVHDKSGPEMQELLFQKGVNWNDYPAFFKRGTYFRRRAVLRPFSAAELGSLPPKHAARANPDLVVERSEVAVSELPPLTKVSNRAAVLFGGAEPVPKAVDGTPAGV
jgi:tRNA(His) guanylyltransferase